MSPHDRPLKRGHTEVLVTSKAITSSTFSQYLVMHSDIETKPLSKLSPFLVGKTLKGIIGKFYKAKKLSGGLLVEVERKEQREAFLFLNNVADYKASVSPHGFLNSSRGVVILEDYLLDIPDKDILDGLRDQGVVNAKRIMLCRDGEEKGTRHINLKFGNTKLPRSVKAGYLSCKFRLYIPIPRRCFRCQKFGHSLGSCRVKATCARIAHSEHSPDECWSPVQYVNSNGPHRAHSRWKN